MTSAETQLPEAVRVPRRARRAADSPPIEFNGLTKRFGSLTAVDSLTFTVQSGKVTGFLGPNGAGKTTTLRMLVGLVAPTSGTATFGGVHYAELDQPQQIVGASLEANFHPGRSGRNHLRVLAATAGVGDDRVDELLALVDLTSAANRPAGGYSLGMRQRLALAGALLGDPEYLILDEPANGLDPEGIRWLRGFLRNYAAQGRVVLVSSHMLNEVQATVDDVVIISRGRLLKQAKMAELNVAIGTSHLRCLNPDRAVEALAELGLETERWQGPEGEVIKINGTDLVEIGAALFRAEVVVYELGRDKVDLEASFFQMLESQT